MDIPNPYFSKVKRTKVPDARDRYSQGIIYEYDGFRFHETYEKPVIDRSPGDKIHEVTMGEINNLPLISFIHYGTVKLWWLIAEANNIHDPLVLEAGTVLKIPSIADYYKKITLKVGINK